MEILFGNDSSLALSTKNSNFVCIPYIYNNLEEYGLCTLNYSLTIGYLIQYFNYISIFSTKLNNI